MYPLNPNAISVTEAYSDTSNVASSSSLADSGEVSGNGGDAPSDGLTDVAGTSTNLTDTADSANSANTSAATDLLSHTSITTTSILSSTTSLAQTTFTNEQVERFQRHYEEEFDLYDPDYYQWLKVHHQTLYLLRIKPIHTNASHPLILLPQIFPPLQAALLGWIYKRLPLSLNSTRM